MARIKFYNIEQAEWEYADMAVQVGGGSADITISGTATGDVTESANWVSPNATYTAVSTMADMLAKVQSKGTITFGGGLTKNTQSYSQELPVPSINYYLPIVKWCGIVPAQAMAALASQVGITADGTTDGLIVHCSGPNASADYENDFELVMCRTSTGTVAILAT
jgi:hypothetical protein